MGTEGLYAGKRVNVICAAESGDLPLEFRWLKNKQHFESINEELKYSITVKQNDEFSSVLTIHNLSSLHSGEYCCEASNAASTVRYCATTFLEVNGIWVVFKKIYIYVDINILLLVACLISLVA